MGEGVTVTTGEWLSSLSSTSNTSALEHLMSIQLNQSAGNCVNADIIAFNNNVLASVSSKPSIQMSVRPSIQFRI